MCRCMIDGGSLGRRHEGTDYQGTSSGEDLNCYSDYLRESETRTSIQSKVGVDGTGSTNAKHGTERERGGTDWVTDSSCYYRDLFRHGLVSMSFLLSLSSQSRPPLQRSDPPHYRGVFLSSSFPHPGKTRERRPTHSRCVVAVRTTRSSTRVVW